MSISSEISKLNTNLSNAYTAVSNKGGTLPANQNFDNLSTAIGSITVYKELPSYQITNGVLGGRACALSGNEFSNVTTIDDYALYYKFYNNTTLTGVLDLSDLTTVNQYGLAYAFSQCTGLTGVDLSALTTINNYGMQQCFFGCTNLTGAVDLSSLTTVTTSGLNSAFTNTGITSVDLSSLTTAVTTGMFQAFKGCISLASVDLSSLATIEKNGMQYTFQGCTSLSSITFTALDSINEGAFYSCFGGCTNLEHIYFPSLTTTSFISKINQFSNMLSSTGTSVTHTLHFPSNMETTISGLTGYPTFGGTSGYVTLLYDLPETT